MSNNERASVMETLTTPAGRGLSSAAGTALVLAGANKLLGSKRAAQAFARMGKAPVQISGRNIAGAALGSGALSALTANMDRSIYARSIMDKLDRGSSNLTSSEKRLVGNKVVPTGTPRGSMSFAEHYFNPASMGAFRGVVGGLMGGFSPLAFAEGAAAGSGGTVINKEILSRALRNRIKRGKDLNAAETRLARRIGEVV